MDQVQKKTGYCIICHEDGKELSDEHVIPDAIGGVYHIYNVCKDCNSELGLSVDKYLLDHFLIQAKRHQHRLKGKKGNVPNPLVTEGQLTDGTKVRLIENKDGQLTAHVIQTKPETTQEDGVTRISFSVDAKDSKLIEPTKKKIYKRLGIDPAKHLIDSTATVNQIQNPAVKLKLSFDLEKYKIGLLKIAYEYTCDIFPTYVNDPTAKEYAEILRKCDLDKLKKINSFGGGFEKGPMLEVLRDFVDLDNTNRHYLILFCHEGKLMCFVSLFDCFSIIFQMSENSYISSSDFMHIAINDIDRHKVDHYTLLELADNIPCTSSTIFHMDEEDDEWIKEMCESGEAVGFSANYRSDTLIYNGDGVPVDTVENLLCNFPYELIKSEYLNRGESRHCYKIPEGFYLMEQPHKKLVKLIAIEIMEKRDLI